MGEQAWVARYVAERRAWLAGSDPATLLPRTVYRMDELKTLIDASSWELPLPLRVRGVAIDGAALMAEAPVIASAIVAEERILRLREPFMQGEDVREAQRALRAAGFSVDADGVFGPGTEAAVKAYRSARSGERRHHRAVDARASRPLTHRRQAGSRRTATAALALPRGTACSIASARGGALDLVGELAEGVEAWSPDGSGRTR